MAVIFIRLVGSAAGLCGLGRGDYASPMRKPKPG